MFCLCYLCGIFCLKEKEKNKNMEEVRSEMKKKVVTLAFHYIAFVIVTIMVHSLYNNLCNLRTDCEYIYYILIIVFIFILCIIDSCYLVYSIHVTGSTN